VSRRKWQLLNFWRYNDVEPVSHEEWLQTCPPRDVTETVEDWYKNNYPKTWREKLAQGAGKIPEFDGKYPDFSLYANAKPPK